MSDDLIKRSDAIGAITNHCENECYYRVDSWCPQCQREEFQEAIKAVPTVDRPQGWIPCSERLPEVHEEPYYADHEEILHESDHVLTCCKYGKGFVYAIGTVIHDEVCDSYEWSELYDYAERVIDDMQVLAWMPLPEPWKGADDDSKRD